ncbi:MAG: hypothetical protein M3H12_05460, partial [Chromatiales bacterium]
AVVEVINKQSAKNGHLMRLIRRLVVTAFKFNVYFKAKHIPGKINVIADRLSRFQEAAPRKVAPWLQSRPDLIPPEILPCLLNAALTEGSKQAYRRAIASCTNFRKKRFHTFSVFPASTSVLAAFAASLFSQNYAPATLMTYMSALSYLHKLADMADPTQHFVIKKVVS